MLRMRYHLHIDLWIIWIAPWVIKHVTKQDCITHSSWGIIPSKVNFLSWSPWESIHGLHSKMNNDTCNAIRICSIPSSSWIKYSVEYMKLRGSSLVISLHFCIVKKGLPLCLETQRSMAVLRFSRQIQPDIWVWVCNVIQKATCNSNKALSSSDTACYCRCLSHFSSCPVYSVSVIFSCILYNKACHASI